MLRSYATFETATSLDDFDLFVRAEQPTPGCEFRAVPGDWPLARYEILVLGDDVIAAFRIVRCALNILRDGADRGVISRFRIIAGADLLRDSSATPWSAASARLFRGTIPCHA